MSLINTLLLFESSFQFENNDLVLKKKVFGIKSCKNLRKFVLDYFEKFAPRFLKSQSRGNGNET